MHVYFITTNAYLRKHLLQSHRMAQLLIEVLLFYRAQNNYLLHEFVVMPDHLHVILTPVGSNTPEDCMRLVKGTTWGRRRREFNLHGHLWQHRFNDHRIRDFNEYAAYRTYLRQNPVKRGLVTSPEEYEYSSASGRYILDPEPKEIAAFRPATDAVVSGRRL